jgi:RNA polymerase sigma-70 factor (ECF subfamily)
MSGDEEIDRTGENRGGEPTSTEVTLALASDDTAQAAARPMSDARELIPGRVTAGELFERYVTFVWRVVAAHGVREADVPDVTQDVFVIAFRRLDSWEPERSSVTSWLYGIATRVAANHRRKAYVRHEAPEDAAPTGRTRSDAALERVLLSELGDALMALDADKRDAFILFEIAELSMHEVAVTLGCPLKTAYKRLYAARRAISEQLGEKGGSR